MRPSAFPSMPLALRSSQVVVSGSQRGSHAIRASSCRPGITAPATGAITSRSRTPDPIWCRAAQIAGRLIPRPVRPCLEPLGFVTSITERDGRDPGVSRLRARPADEARLITVPRGDLFCEGDVPGVRFAHMSGSPRPDTPGMEGRLVVINRGPRGTGFLRCIRCEYAEPAPRAFALQKVSAHKAPRTGEACPGSDATLQVQPVDLAHFFETDVVQLRFARPLPEALADSARDAFLRTLAEVLRLAACRLIRVDRRDLRSTYVYAGGPVVALYDGIPGGAGYSRRIGTEEAPIRRLLEEAADILECHMGRCASSCRACLNDYANQLWWDIFDRRPVLEWMRTLLDERVAPIAGGEAGAVRWATPSLAELAAKFTGRTDVFFCAPNLSSPEPDPASARAVLACLREMAEHNTRVNIVTTSGSGEGVASLPAAERALFYYLGEFAAPGIDRLRWLQAPVPGPHTPIHAMPARVFSVSTQGSLAVLTDLPSGPLLDQLLPGNLSLLASSEDPLALATFVQTLKPLDSAGCQGLCHGAALGAGHRADARSQGNLRHAGWRDRQDRADPRSLLPLERREPAPSRGLHPRTVRDPGGAGTADRDLPP